MSENSLSKRLVVCINGKMSGRFTNIIVLTGSSMMCFGFRKRVVGASSSQSARSLPLVLVIALSGVLHQEFGLVSCCEVTSPTLLSINITLAIVFTLDKDWVLTEPPDEGRTLLIAESDSLYPLAH